MKWIACLLALTLTLSPATWAKDVFPVKASLGKSEVNVRSGPGTRYPITWVFQQRGYPVKLLRKYDNWYQIQDLEGEKGWVYQGMISRRTTAVVNKAPYAVLTARADGKKPLLRLAKGVVVQHTEACTGKAICPVKTNGHEGFIATKDLRFLK